MDKKETLNDYGVAFQNKTAACLITDKQFMDQIADILSADFYDGESMQWIIRKTLQYYDEYRDSPTLDFFKTEILSEESEPLKAGVIERLRKIWTQRGASDIPYVKDRFLEFAKRQKVKKVIEESAVLVQSDQFDQIRSKFNEALNAGMRKDVGHMYKDEVVSRLEKAARDTVPCGYPALDGVLDGGLGPGEIGVFMGASGAGKSWMLATVGANAVRAGYNVAHYSLELSETQTGLRYDSIFSGYSPSEVREHKQEVIDAVNRLEGNLSITYWPTKSASTQTVFAHVERLKSLKWKPDLILVDYAGIMKPMGQFDSNYEAMGNIYTDLRQLSGELQIPVWTASQTQRSAIRSDVIEADQIADSYKKVMISDFVCSISRKKSDKLSNTARFHVIKSRFGQDGGNYPAVMNTGTGEISIYEQDSDMGRDLMRKMDQSEDEVLKKEMSRKYEQFKARSSTNKLSI